MTELFASVRKVLPHLVIGAMCVAVLAVMLIRQNHDVLATNIGITVYPSGVAMVQVPYRQDGPRGTVSISVDTDNDAVFNDAEMVLRDVPALPQTYWNSNFYYRPASSLPERVLVRVVSGDESVTRRVRVRRSTDALTPDDFKDVTRPNDSMTQGISRYAPDLQQRQSECAPNAAANVFISLAKEYDQDGRLPADAQTMIDELKGDMRWNRSDGVFTENFSIGSNLWATKKGLPIHTETVGAANGVGTVEAIARALEGGAMATLRLAFALPDGRTMNTVGGHAVTIVAVTKTEGGTFLELHDPATSTGTDVFEVRDGRIEYPLFSGSTSVGIGFVHTWTGLQR